MQVLSFVHDETSRRVQIIVGPGPGRFSTPSAQANITLPAIAGETEDAMKVRAIAAAKQILREASDGL